MAIVENPEPITAPDGVKTLLRDLIHEHTGCYFEAEQIETMLEKLRPLAEKQGSRSFLDYYYLLKYDQEGRSEWPRVMDALSVQETYFWREMSQIDALVKIVVPKWFAASREPLRIWSAACATGEEPYTIAMALCEAGWGSHPIEIRASDASEAALEKARRATYRERSFRTLPPLLQARYFRKSAEGWQLSPDITKRVSFARANIVVRTDIASLATVPVIFCRNVFIYFSHDAIRRALVSFAHFMPSDGYLFVGASESLVKLTMQFELQEILDAFVYKRKSVPEGVV